MKDRLYPYLVRIRDIFRAMRRPWLQRRYMAADSPYRALSAADREAFQPVLDVWRPDDAPQPILLRWLLTEWCNYDCAYCPQTHNRFAKKGGGLTAHGFDNFPLDKWLDAFARHFSQSRLSLVITGGEPLLDRARIVPFLNALTRCSWCETVRIDTNASFRPDLFVALDKSKIVLMCTFHPSQVAADRFYRKIDALLAAGFSIGMVNYVMTPENFAAYRTHKAALWRRGIPLHPNPLWGNARAYTGEQRRLLKEDLGVEDFLYRSMMLSPHGKKCLFPALAYELDYKGSIQLGCHEATAASIFADSLPRLFAGPVPCPQTSCVCLDKYSFLEGMNRNANLDPFSDLAARLRDRNADAILCGPAR